MGHPAQDLQSFSLVAWLAFSGIACRRGPFAIEGFERVAICYQERGRRYGIIASIVFKEKKSTSEEHGAREARPVGALLSCAVGHSTPCSRVRYEQERPCRRVAPAGSYRGTDSTHRIPWPSSSALRRAAGHPRSQGTDQRAVPARRLAQVLTLGTGRCLT
ncbi:hypothetical protein GGR56DRAFT_638546 [Xylariaceae sp. FL0804]|nr:hypothetical protein GGR56DRAFT_638546 [Xylariaceae sp. FL0804]